MSEAAVTTRLDESAVQELAAGFGGELLLPGDEGYEEARSVWNAMIDNHPALIARCRGTADVIAAVNFGRSQNLPVSVRGGGHSVAGTSVADQGLMLDLSLMRAVIVNPEERTAIVQGGALWSDLDREAQAFGLAVTGGHISHTGVGGLTTGGGIGWLVRKYGLSSDNLIAADVVTADGRLVRASESENSDLFWGVRGGGGNFGVVTTFTFRLHPLGTMVVGGLALWPLNQAQHVLDFFRAYADRIPDELTLVLAFLTAPPLPFVPDDLQGRKAVAIIVCYAGDLDEGLRAVQPIKDLAPAADVIGPIPYLAQQTLLDAVYPHGHRYYTRTDFLDGLSDEGIEILTAAADAMSAPFSTITFQHYLGAVNALPADATAYSHRDAKFTIFTLAQWASAADDAENIGWCRRLAEAMRPYSRGAYVNFLGADETDRLRAAYRPETLERLQTLKRTYDPQNLFRLNLNINPES
ncbi:MAG TPA: FAD-binding oxidoreductase [Chloroflexota bacterium]|nr:FAD-binding oxidoreductase [Chloroflexota bacterium]